jgi:hypothetical protein
MTSRAQIAMASAVAVVLGTAPLLAAYAVGALVDGQMSLAVAKSGNGNGNGGNGGKGHPDANHGPGGEHGRSADKGDIDGDGTPGRSGVHGLGQAVSDVASDDSTTGRDKADAIHVINHAKFLTIDSDPLDR